MLLIFMSIRIGQDCSPKIASNAAERLKMKTKQEIKEIILEARELGLEFVEIDGVKYGLGKMQIAAKTFVEEMKAEEIVKPLSVLDEYSEEEIKYWATSYFDELQAKKEARSKQKQLDDELREAV